MVKSGEANFVRHQEFQRQLQLALTEPGVPPGSALDVSFLTRYFALAGLPLRCPKDERSFVRNTDEFVLSINAPDLGVLGGTPGEKFNVGVPYGAKARLLTVWLSTVAQDPNRSSNDRWFDIGPIKPWLQSIGINYNGDTPSEAKKQLIRLSFATFNMQVRRSGFDLFADSKLVEKIAFNEKDMDHYRCGNMKTVRWPVGVQITEAAFRLFRENAVAIPTQRLEKVSHSAMAIDTFIYLCYRLPLIGPGDDELVLWRTLATQFGSREAPSKFKDHFLAPVGDVLDAYPEAKVEIRSEGLLLRHSDPVELRRAFVSMTGTAGQITQKRQRRNRLPLPQSLTASYNAGKEAT
jgi:hypothetical protein